MDPKIEGLSLQGHPRNGPPIYGNSLLWPVTTPSSQKVQLQSESLHKPGALNGYVQHCASLQVVLVAGSFQPCMELSNWHWRSKGPSNI